MSQGFIAYNNSNQILVSSDLRNLHFIAKLTSPTLADQTDYYGGLRRLTYSVSCSVTPVPFFTCPTGDFYGITGIKSSGSGSWDIEIIRSGTSSTYPEVYVFADPRGSTATDSHGMIVYRDDGTPAFDSRLRPLAVTGGVSVSHPSNPKPSYPYGLSSDNCSSMGSAAGGLFAPDQYNTFSVSLTLAKPMFHYSSLAQAQRQADYHRSQRDCDFGFDVYGNCIGYGTEKNWDSHYWCFYRGGIRPGYNYVDAGWIAVYWGCNWTYNADDSLFGIGVGGSGGSGGSWAYSNDTINLASTSVIIGDASRYD